MNNEICLKCGEIHEKPSKGWKQNYGEPVSYTECDIPTGCEIDGDHHRHPSHQYMHPLTRTHDIEVVAKTTQGYDEEMSIIASGGAMVDNDIKNGIGSGLTIYQHMQYRMHDVRGVLNE